MKQYLIKKVFKNGDAKNTNYYDWFIGKFVENFANQPLKKLYTKHFNSIAEAEKEISNFDNEFIEIEL